MIGSRSRVGRATQRRSTRAGQLKPGCLRGSQHPERTRHGEATDLRGAGAHFHSHRFPGAIRSPWGSDADPGAHLELANGWKKNMGPRTIPHSVMPPIREGFRRPCARIRPTSRWSSARWNMSAGACPYFCEEFRDDVEVVSERIVDRVDPVRFFPLIGPAQLHHCHWKCTIYYTETIESGYPFPFQTKRPRIEVVYIDKDHLHLSTGNHDPQTSLSFTEDLAGR